MKKKIFSLAFIAMSLVAFSGMAQNQSSRGCDKQENVKCCKAEKKCHNKDRMNPYEGLTLSDSQKAQLKQLDEKRMADRRQQSQLRKEEKQRNDSVQKADRKASRKAYLEEVKAIVGPDQYVLFLENMYVNTPGQGHDKAVKQGHHGDKQGKMQGNRPMKGHDKKQPRQSAPQTDKK